MTTQLETLKVEVENTKRFTNDKLGLSPVSTIFFLNDEGAGLYVYPANFKKCAAKFKGKCKVVSLQTF